MVAYSVPPTCSTSDRSEAQTRGAPPRAKSTVPDLDKKFLSKPCQNEMGVGMFLVEPPLDQWWPANITQFFHTGETIPCSSPFK